MSALGRQQPLRPYVMPDAVRELRNGFVFGQPAPDEPQLRIARLARFPGPTDIGIHQHVQALQYLTVRHTRERHRAFVAQQDLGVFRYAFAGNCLQLLRRRRGLGQPARR